MEAGSRLGPYEIVSRIGAGGMGEVWRARDTRLGREVAIKILPPEFAQDAKLKTRFEREAQTISHLTHPNICTLFDVGDDYIVMELLEGESLADRIARGPLPLTEVIRYGVQIAEALGKAHREGVVHRDLKPGNVMITKSGAKLLDFGLAKSSAAAASPLDATVQKPLTEQGTVLGTFQYMAPEQLAGEEPDARTDIFALGAVLYEMATGKRAFEGKNRTSLIAAIVSGEPRAIRELQPLTPPMLEHVILKCLEKEPDDRWQNASDIAEELRWISQAGSQGGVAPIMIARRKWREWLMLAAIAASLSAVAVLAWLLWQRPAAELPTIDGSIGLEPTGGIGYWSGPPAFSPDGKTLAFAADDKNGRRMLWIRSLAGSAPQALANTDGATSPFWSPDGKFIAFVAAGKLQKIAVGGGESDIIADADLSGGGSWNRDGVIIYKRSLRSSVFRITPGGEPASILDPQSLGATRLLRPWFLPDGNHFLVYALAGATQPKGQRDGVWIATLDGREAPRFLTAADSQAIYVEPGWLLFAREGVLRAQRFDSKTMQLSGDSNAIVPVQHSAVLRYATFATSNAGLLVYLKPGSLHVTELQLRDRSGELVRTLGRGDFWCPSLSDDGRRVAVDLGDDSGQGDIWMIDVDTATRARLSFDPVNETSPVWSPDNRTVAYEGPSGPGDLGIIAKSAGGVAEMLVDLPGTSEDPTDWSPDGRFIAFYRFGARTDGDVLVLSVATGTTTDVATTPADEAAAVFSPDSRWIAYQSDESGRREVYVQPFPPTGAKYQISTSGGRWPRWRVADTIEYVDESGHFSSAHVETTNGLSVDPPQTHPLLVDDRGDLRFRNFDVGPDGKVLVNAMIRDNPAPLNLLVNWYSRLE